MEQIKALDVKIREMAGRIRELRMIEGLTIEEMAEKTGVSEAEYAACERVDFRTSTSRLFTVARSYST